MISRRFIYFPDRTLVATPGDVGLDFEDVSIDTSDDVRLHAWFVAGDDPLFLWFHGNGGNISHRVELLKLLHDHLGVSMFVVSYRGYGLSHGVPSERGTYLDARAALRSVQHRTATHPPEIVYFGQSLGAAVALELATVHPPRAVILESPFTSIADMARHHYSPLPVWPLLRNRYDSLSRIARIRAPVLVIHGSHDDIVPLRMAQRLYDAASGPKRLAVIDGAGHNDVHVTGGSMYYEVMRTFVHELGE